MCKTSPNTARTALRALVMLLAIGLAGCTTTGLRGHYHHEPAVWYDYYYYPALEVYVDVRHGYYWHREHDRWHRVKRLPAHLWLHDRPRVLLRLDTDRPYRDHARHRERYPAHAGRGSRPHDRRGRKHDQIPIAPPKGRHREPARVDRRTETGPRPPHRSRRDRVQSAAPASPARHLAAPPAVTDRRPPITAQDTRSPRRLRLERRATASRQSRAGPAPRDRSAARVHQRRHGAAGGRDAFPRERARKQADAPAKAKRQKPNGDAEQPQDARRTDRHNKRWRTRSQDRGPSENRGRRGGRDGP